jgi:CRP/FNR family cyclic AMP-dependent transcriptional regulator
VPLSPIEVLRKVPLFSGLSEADLSAFAELTRERSYPKGSVIVFEDDPGDALFLVAAGQVKVVLIAEDGREVILSVLGEGSFFGEMAVIDGSPGRRTSSRWRTPASWCSGARTSMPASATRPRWPSPC